MVWRLPSTQKHFSVDESASDEISFVGVAVVLERIRQEVVYVYHAAVGVGRVALHVGVLPYYVVGVELEYVGVHLEYQQIAGHLQLRLELAAVAIFDPHAAVEPTVELVVHLRSHFEERVFQLVECRKCIVENALFKRRFADDSLQNLLSECAHVVCRYFSLTVCPSTRRSVARARFILARGLSRMPYH